MTIIIYIFPINHYDHYDHYYHQYHHQRQMAGELSDVTLAMLDNSGHMTMVDQPLQMSSELTAFWNLVEEKKFH